MTRLHEALRLTIIFPLNRGTSTTLTDLLRGIHDILHCLSSTDACCLGGIVEIMQGNVAAITVIVVRLATTTTHAHNRLLSVLIHIHLHVFVQKEVSSGLVLPRSLVFTTV